MMMMMNMNYTRCTICQKAKDDELRCPAFDKNTSMAHEAYQTFIGDWVARARVRCAWAIFNELFSINKTVQDFS